MQALGSWFSAYTYMGVKAYKSEHGLRRPTKDSTLLTSHEVAGRTTHQSNALFSWLFKACLAYQLYEWLRVSQLSHTLLHCCTACSKDTKCVEVTVKPVGCCSAENVGIATCKLNTSICTHTAVHVILWHIFTCCCSVQAHWTATVHFAYLAATGTFVLSLLPFLYFGFHTYWHWYRADSKDSPQPSAATGVDNPSQEASEAQSGDLHPTPMFCCMPQSV